MLRVDIVIVTHNSYTFVCRQTSEIFFPDETTQICDALQKTR